MIKTLIKMWKKKKQVKGKKGFNIPNVNREGVLIRQLLPAMISGCLNILDKKSKLYIYLFVRLIDKAFNEYIDAKKYIEKEIETGDNFTYMFEKINHLENCLNAISRAGKIFNIIICGVNVKKGKKTVNIKKNPNIINFFNPEDIETIKIIENKENTIRNRIEHINEDIYLDKFKKNLSVDVDEKYQKICINQKCITFVELKDIIENYYKFVLGIFENLPNRIEKGVYSYDKK